VQGNKKRWSDYCGSGPCQQYLAPFIKQRKFRCLT
jgi:hypothetical protein